MDHLADGPQRFVGRCMFTRDRGFVPEVYAEQAALADILDAFYRLYRRISHV
jgi:hypothetical protein